MPSTIEFASTKITGPHGPSLIDVLFRRKANQVTGDVEPGFEGVRDAFARNFAKNLELGAQLSVYVKGKQVVNLHGASKHRSTVGYSDDTLQCVFSSGKNLEAICLAMLWDRGLFKYEDLVVKYWPEFGKHGKDTITIAQVCRHEAGLAVLSRPGHPMNPEKDFAFGCPDISDGNNVDQILEECGRFNGVGRDGEHREEGSRVYHLITRGLIVDGLIRRIDPNGRSLSQFLQEEICAPLGITIYCGMDEDSHSKHHFAPMTMRSNLSVLCRYAIPGMLGLGKPTIWNMMKLELTQKNAKLGAIPRLSIKEMGKGPDVMNELKGRKMRLSSASVQTNAKSMGKLHAALANGGTVDGVKLMSEDAVREMLSECKVALDSVVRCDTAMTKGGFGVFKSFGDLLDLKPLSGFMGWGGWGGSLCVVNAAQGIAISYTMNGMSPYLIGDDRSKRIIAAVEECLLVNHSTINRV